MSVTIANYSYRQKITGDAPSSSLSGFRVLITEDSVDSTFWDNVDDDGGDVRASINVNGTDQLPLQIVRCNTSTEKLLAYVRFPTYSTSARELHVFSGNTGQTQPSVTSTYGRNNVNQDSTLSSDLESLSPVDSSGNTSLTASASGVTLATDGGAQGNGNIFSGGAGVGYTVADNSVVNNDYISLSAWVVLSGNAPFARLLGKQYQVNLLIKNGRPSAELWTSAGVGQPASPRSLTLGAKTHIAYVYNGSNMSFYVNGSLDRSINLTTGTLDTNSSDLYIGRRRDSVESFNGKIYEINTTALVRSADYIASEYANQNDPANFWAQSTPDDPSGGGGTDVDVDVTGVEATGAVGTVTVTATINVNTDVTGVEATGAVGTATVTATINVNTDVTGVEATGAVGTATVTTGSVAALTGVEATGAVGTATADTSSNIDVDVTGVEATGAVGTATVTTGSVVALTGVEATSAVGTVTVTATTDVDVDVTGVEATGAVGTVTITENTGVDVTGVEATGAVGTVTITENTGVDVTGVQTTTALGNLSTVTGAVVALTGVEATTAVGTATVNLNAGASVTGVQATTALGSVTALSTVIVPITGLVAYARTSTANVWGLIDSSQTPSWDTIANPQVPDWNDIPT